MKWLMYVLLVVLVGGSWLLYSKSGDELKQKQDLVQKYVNEGESEEAAKVEGDIQTIEGQRTFNGILLAFLSAGLVGIVFVFQILPMLAHKVTHAVYDSGEMMEHDVMHDARSLLAQGEYHAAIDAFRAAAAKEPLNRLPIVEIAKIQKDNLGDPEAAIHTIRGALESQEWEVNDAAYFLFRLAELYDEVQGDRVTAMAIMQQVVEQFPNTRHSANAQHKIHEWEVQAANAEAHGEAMLAEQNQGLEGYEEGAAEYQARLAAEEAEYLARMQAGETPGEGPAGEESRGA